MIANSLSGFSAPLADNTIQTTSVVEEKKETSKEKSVVKNMTAEEYVKKYFSDIPIMIEVAKCESRFRQYDANGNVLRGEINYLDRGVMQINQFYHEDNSGKLGYDLLTIEGNTAYARHLYEMYGLRPWKSSAPCWAKTITYNDFISNRSH